MEKLDKECFQILWDIQKEQPWIANTRESEAVLALLFDECPDGESQKLIIELLNRFKYLSNEDFKDMLHAITEDIVTDPELEDFNTQLVAMATDRKSDSSQLVLYALKSILEDYGWREHLTVNRFGLVWDTYKHSRDHKNVVLLDEFIGSGDTVINHIDHIENIFKEKGVTDFSIQVKVIVATKHGYDRVIDRGVKINAQVQLSKGITDFYSGMIRESMKNMMLKLESLLLPAYKEKPMPSFGKGAAEALYAREEGNTPNNVFPIFWWPYYKDHSHRNTLLTRAMSDA
ncbi:hypothetical protein [Gimesia chilikensis]|uniref:PRTase-CE domain-containing protein n=1 Tax=Gimesia chilikensis TaxID=2605989 RepID=A0A517PUN6_9PLAN|nr:hypothetical protein [Gimesia chilikensis]QDT23082.1 hypothetical protein HG66A1_48950 [Gimesia chilikensis]